MAKRTPTNSFNDEERQLRVLEILHRAKRVREQAISVESIWFAEKGAIPRVIPVVIA